MKALRWVAMACVGATLGFVGCDGGSDATPDADVSGTWTGPVTRNDGLGTAQTTLVLTRTGSEVSGTYTEGGFGTEQITGVVDGNSVVLSLARSGYSTTFDLDVDGDAMTGTWTSLGDTGASSSGTISLTRAD